MIFACFLSANPRVASASCLPIAGDINGNGVANVSDTQCLFLGILWELAGGTGAEPLCAVGGVQTADLDCNGTINVTDATLHINIVFALPLNVSLDANANFCIDACEAIGTCGNGIVEAGETCDDDNTIAGDGCSDTCQSEGSAVFTVPYTQSFDSATKLSDVAWNIDTDVASAANNWGLTKLGLLGPDSALRFGFDPIVTNFTDRAVSPVIDAGGFSNLTLVFEHHFMAFAPISNLTLSVVARPNSTSPWSSVWSHTVGSGSVEPTTVNINVSSVLGNADKAQFAFQVTGGTSLAMILWDVDTVSLLPGLAPTLAAIPQTTAIANATTDLVVTASDPDTADMDLVFSLNNAPGFVALNNGNDGTATLTLTPTTADIGIYSGIQVSVTDGTFVSSQTFSVFVATAGGGGGTGTDPGTGVTLDPNLKYILIRDATGGGGNLVGNLNLAQGDSKLLVAAGYTATLDYLYDVKTLWETIGTINTVPAGPSTSVVFNATTAGTSGKVRTIHPAPTVVNDETGLITVAIAPPGPPSVTKSTLTASKSALIANGTDTATITLTTKDAAGNIVTTPATVSFATSAGTLSGGVTNNGDGTYSQTLVAAAAPATATITATLNGQPVTATVVVQFVTENNLVGQGVLTIDCVNYPTWANKDLVIKGGTVNINSGGCSPMVFGHIFVINNGILTHAATTTVKEQRIDIHVKSLTVDSTSKIDVNNKGYTAKVGWNNQTAFGTCTGCGGSHGGLGGQKNSGGVPGPTYDNMYAPSMPGGGGNTGVGGGVVRVKVTDTTLGSIVIDGTVSADGQGANAGGGAGGSIYFDTPRLAGKGALYTRGGTSNGGCCDYAGGAGGGRIAIVNAVLNGNFTLDKIATNVKVHGGTGYFAGGSGTLFVKQSTDTWGTLILDNNGTSSPADSTPLVDLGSGDFESLTATEGFDADLVGYATDFFIGYRLNPNTDQGASLTLTDDTTFVVTGNGLKNFVTTGDMTTAASVGSPYRSFYVFDNLEIRGRANLKTTGDILVYNGDIGSADTITLKMDGSVNCRVLDVNEVETVLVNNGTFAPDIVVSHQDETYPLDYILNNGSISRQTLLANHVTAVGGTIDVGTANIDSALSLDGTTMTVTARNLTVGGAVDLLGTAVLRHGTTSASDVQTLYMEVGSLTIASTAKIDVIGRGYLKNYSYLNSTAYGSVSNAGGSHGGLGGLGNNGAAKAALAMDDMYGPTEPGSGSGNGSSGGGAVQIVAAGSVIIDGGIYTDGAGSNPGGGAGGSIWIDAAVLSGTGVLSAKGGNGNGGCCDYAGGGGGGRIALYATQFAGGFAGAAAINRLNAGGGTGYNNGGAGTAFMKSGTQLYGDLIVNNNNVASPGNSTPLISFDTSTIDGLTATTLFDPDGSFLGNSWYRGVPVNPDITQGSPTSLADDQFRFVTTNNLTTLNFKSGVDLTTLSAVGKSYRSLHVFDNLEVRGRANLSSLGDILVHKGDLATGDNTTMVIDGAISANAVDVQNVANVTVKNGGVTVPNLLGTNVADPALNWTIQSATVTKDYWKGNSLNMQGGLLRIGAGNVTTAVVMDNAATLELYGNGLTVGGGMTVKGNSNVTHTATTAATTYAVKLQVTDFLLESGSTINVAGKGYLAQYADGNSKDFGSKSNSGGSHGGLGGNGNNGASSPGTTYDSYANPSQPGGGGGNGGIGGGVVRIIASGNVGINGQINADGQGSNPGGGAGGSVYIQAGHITGTGEIRARGGNGNGGCCDYAGAGGGGRVSLVAGAFSGSFTNALLHTIVRADGGTGYNNGGAGTIYVRSGTQTYGDLIVDNRGTTSPVNSTPLVEVGTGTVSSVTPSTLKTLAALWPTNRFADTWINPKIPQGDAATFTDDSLLKVTANDLTELTLAGGDVSAVTSAGQTFRSLYVFDNIEIIGKANVVTSGDLLVYQGDRTSNNTTTLSLGGTISANVVELVGITHIGINGGGIKAGAIWTDGVADHPYIWSGSGGTVDLPLVRGTSWTTTGVSVIANTFEVLGNATLAGGTSVIGIANIGLSWTLDSAANVTIQNKTVDIAGTLTLMGGSVLSHPAATNSAEYSLEIDTTHLSINDTSSIDVSAKGYPKNRTFDLTTLNASVSNAGGSHGGFGGHGNNGASNFGVAYDSYMDPQYPGAGSGNGSAGGGLIRINAAGSVTVNGSIKADGGSSNPGGGAGGGIAIVCNHLGGTGIIQANGGNGNGGCCDYAGAGGGGRIAVTGFVTTAGAFALPSPNIVAKGGTGYNNGGAGTVYLRSTTQTYGDLIVDNKNTTSPAKSTSLVSTGDFTITEVTANTVKTSANAWQVGRFLDIWVNLNVTAGNPKTRGDDPIVRVTTNTGDTLTTIGGDLTLVTQPGKTARTTLAVDNLSVRGKANLFIDGDITVLGGDLISNDTTTLKMDGTVQANALDVNNSTDLTLEAGGLIVGQVLGHGTDTHPYKWSFLGGTTTLDQVYGTDVIISASTLHAGTLSATTSLLVDNAGVLEIFANLVNVGNQVTIKGNSTVRHWTTTASTVYKLEITAPNFSLAAGSVIDTTGRGYTKTYSWGNTTSLGTTNNTGGTHAGLGGKGNAGKNPGPTYGNMYNPTHPGGGSGNGSSGGGVVRIVATNNVAIDGTIQAAGASSNPGGGAGGSIYIKAGFLTGTGLLDVRGGNGNSACCDYAGAGGGGRIAIEYTTLSGGFALSQILSRFDARGGTGYNNGGAGTIYLKGASQNWGDLIVDNKNATTPVGSTPLVDLGSGTLTQVTDTSVSDSGAGWLSNYFVGYYVNPNIAQGNPLSLADDVVFRTNINDQFMLDVDGDPTLVAASGDVYRSIYVFDNIEITGQASVVTGGDVFVLKGDILSFNDTTIQFGGLLSANRLDLNNVTTIKTTGTGGYSVNTLLGHGTDGYAYDYVLGGGSLTHNVITANNFTATNTNLTSDFLDVTGDVTFNGGTSTVGAVLVGGDMTLTGTTDLTISDTDVVVAGDLTLGGTSILRHPAGTTTEEYRLELDVDRLIIASTAKIDVTGRGYVKNRGPQNTTTYAATGNSGGSHGGLGAKGNNNGLVGIAHGSLVNPQHPGGGSGNGSNGGGLVRVKAATAAIIDGEIVANGGSSNPGGGAGGGIYIDAAAISGGGKLSANGGNGNGGCCDYAGGGGGGRIALANYSSLSGGFVLTNLHNACEAKGGTGYGNGGAGTIFARGALEPFGSLIIDNENVAAPETSTIIYTAGTGLSTYLDATTLTDPIGDWKLGSGAIVGTHVAPKKNDGLLTSLNDDPIFEIVGVTATDLVTDPDLTATAVAGDTYQGVLALQNMEIRGKARVWVDADVLVQEGDITSNNTTALVIDGSFKSQRLDVTDVTTITINNGTFEAGALFAADVDDYPFGWAGNSSTINLTDWNAQSANFNTVNLNIGTGYVETDFLQNAGTTTVSGGLLQVDGTYSLLGGAILTHPAGTDTTWYTLLVKGTSMVISAGSKIDVTAKGFAVGRTYGNLTTIASAGNSGGSYGGLGAKGNGNNAQGICYGDFRQPLFPGGGGKSNGGGAVKVEMTGLVQIDGSIVAAGGTNTGGAGAGGAIYIDANTINGTGIIDARGGNGTASSPYGGGGGGGRIAIHYTNASGNFTPTAIATKVLADGGTGYGVGGAGTIFMKATSQTYGDLIIDSADKVAPVNSTVLPSIGTGLWTAVSATTLTDLGQLWISGMLKNLMVTSKVAQGAATLTDDVVHTVSSNTANVLTVTPSGVDTIAAIGDTYRGIIRLNRLEVRKKAQVLYDGDILVQTGDLHSADAAAFDIPTGSKLTATVIELVGKVQAKITVAGAVTATQKLICADCP